MVHQYPDSSILVPELVHQLIAAMASSLDSFAYNSRSNHNNHAQRSRRLPNSPSYSNIPACPQGYKSAAVDVLILIAVIGSSGFLLYPYIRFICVGFVNTVSSISYLVKEEICDAPLIYASIALCVFCAALATWALVACTGYKCGNPHCKGLSKAAEFDIQLETEECVKNSSSTPDNNNSSSYNNNSNRCIFELPINHHRELQAELKKMAPPNGRAVLVFRARCGCSVGRLEVPGPKKSRKIKK